MARKTVNWDKMWFSFDEWVDNREKPETYNFPEWEEQQAKIQKLVNTQVRKLMEKKT